MDMNKHDILEQRMCRELELVSQKYSQNAGLEMSVQDLEKIDKLYHALKSMATYKAMKDAESYEEGEWNSGKGSSEARGRGADGRYISRDGYADGYSRGYSDAMSREGGSSGHYPMPYYEPRRW